MNIILTRCTVSRIKTWCVLCIMMTMTLTLSGCASNTSNAAPWSPLSVRPQLPKILQSEVKVSIFGYPDTLEYSDQAYVKLNNYSTLDSDRYESYVARSVANMGVFREVAASTPSVRINAKPVDVVKMGKTVWYQRQDPLSMHDLQAKFANKNVLLLETTLREQEPPTARGFKIGRDYSVAVNVIELKTGKTLFYAEMQGKALNRINPSVVDPVLAEVQQWLRQVRIMRPMV